MGSRAILDDARLLPSAEETEIMGMPATHGAITTIEELLALPEDGMRHELLDGVHAVTPAPQYLHQKAVVELEFLLLGGLHGTGRTPKCWRAPQISSSVRGRSCSRTCSWYGSRRKNPSGPGRT